MKYDFWKRLKREKSKPSVAEEFSASKRVREWSRYGRGVRHIAVNLRDRQYLCGTKVNPEDWLPSPFDGFPENVVKAAPTTCRYCVEAATLKLLGDLP